MCGQRVAHIAEATQHGRHHDCSDHLITRGESTEAVYLFALEMNLAVAPLFNPLDTTMRANCFLSPVRSLTRSLLGHMLLRRTMFCSWTHHRRWKCCWQLVHGSNVVAQFGVPAGLWGVTRQRKLFSMIQHRCIFTTKIQRCVLACMCCKCSQASGCGFSSRLQVGVVFAMGRRGRGRAAEEYESNTLTAEEIRQAYRIMDTVTCESSRRRLTRRRPGGAQLRLLA